MTDEELIARLRSMHWCVTTKANGVGVSDKAVAPEAADRIEELSKERDQHWDSFVHWRKEADDRSEQLAAARQDAKEAEAYAEELEKDRDALDAKLAKAVKALHNAAIQLDWCQAAREISKEIDATLAEIKGESHD